MYEDLIKDIDMAFNAISCVLVSGDAVDAMALARMKLQSIRKRLSEMDESDVSETREE